MRQGPALDRYVFTAVDDITITFNCWGDSVADVDHFGDSLTAAESKTPSEVKAEAVNPGCHSAFVTVSGGRFKCFPGGTPRGGSDDYDPDDVVAVLEAGTYVIGAGVPDGITGVGGGGGSGSGGGFSPTTAGAIVPVSVDGTAATLIIDDTGPLCKYVYGTNHGGAYDMIVVAVDHGTAAPEPTPTSGHIFRVPPGVGGKPLEIGPNKDVYVTSASGDATPLTGALQVRT